jgi:hypothetical protein
MHGRLEARTVPTLLVAPSVTRTEREDQQKDYEAEEEAGWYADGAYVALPNSETRSRMRDPRTDFYDDYEEGEVDDGSDEDPQEAYYSALLARFSRLRLLLQTKPPSTQVPAPSPEVLVPSERTSHNTLSNISSPAKDFSSLLSTKASVWRYALRCTAPTTRLLGKASQVDVMRILGRLDSLITHKTILDATEGANLGAWAWGLLARCRVVEEMGSEDVGVLRNLGKTALWVAAKLRMDGAAVASTIDPAENEMDKTGHERSGRGCGEPY